MWSKRIVKDIYLSGLNIISVLSSVAEFTSMNWRPSMHEEIEIEDQNEMGGMGRGGEAEDAQKV